MNDRARCAMLESWALILWLVRPDGSTFRDAVNGFERRSECYEFATRYRRIEQRFQVEYLCEAEVPDRPVRNATR
jgi:hypothetical protein